MKLTPKIHPYVQNFLNNKERLFNLVDAYDAPLGIIFPSLIHENIVGFNDIFKKHNIRGKIHFAHKCNKSTAVIKTIKNEGINIDVASLNELKHVLSCGFTGLEIEGTGPKNDKFIILGLEHNIMFNCDNINELETIIKFHTLIGKREKTNILIRLNNFHSNEIKILNKQSKFGTPIETIDEILKIFINNKDIINLKGFSFHLDTISQEEKIIAIENLIEIINYSYNFDLNPNIIDIGGGFKVNYIGSEDIWNNYISELKENIIKDSNDLWNNNTFGLQIKGKNITGTFKPGNYYNKKSRHETLDEILSSKSQKFKNRTLGEVLSENMINLIIEPGKSLLDNVGITITNINYTKTSAKNDLIIGLNTNKDNLVIGGEEMLIDPILISKHPDNKTTKTFITGNLCLEADIVFNRKVEFDNTPQKEDLIIFINTAGYYMDFYNSSPSMQNKVTRIAYINNKIYMDDKYEPVLHGIRNENK